MQTLYTDDAARALNPAYVAGHRIGHFIDVARKRAGVSMQFKLESGESQMFQLSPDQARTIAALLIEKADLIQNHPDKLADVIKDQLAKRKATPPPTAPDAN